MDLGAVLQLILQHPGCVDTCVCINYGTHKCVFRCFQKYFHDNYKLITQNNFLPLGNANVQSLASNLVLFQHGFSSAIINLSLIVLFFFSFFPFLALC